MKKILFTFLLSMCMLPIGAEPMENETIFRAMKDEMSRTLKELHIPGSPRPYYVMGEVQTGASWETSANLGELLRQEKNPHKSSFVAKYLLQIGNAKNDNTGYEGGNSGGWRGLQDFTNTYEGLRQALWGLSDRSYAIAVDLYEKKQAYKRKKDLKSTLPDFPPAKQVHYIEPIEPFIMPANAPELQELVKRLSARGKKYAFLEEFEVSLLFGQTDTFYLNSDGGKAQWTLSSVSGRMTTKFRNSDGYVQSDGKDLHIKNRELPSEEELTKEVDTFLAKLVQIQQAKKAEPYLGPVLLAPEAAASFLGEHFINNMNNAKAFLQGDDSPDYYAGKFRNQVGMRVMSNVIDLYDRPSLREYEGETIDTFRPLDAEGVKPQNLTLAEHGRVKELPLGRKPIGKNHQSNGHAYLDPTLNNTREGVFTMVVEPKKPLSQKELEEALLARCRELELEYCYIAWEYPSSVAERIYTKDGHKEWVYGIMMDIPTTRSLRDIIAAGDKKEVHSFYGSNHSTVITPALLLEELELLPEDRKPEQKPFIPKPAFD